MANLFARIHAGELVAIGIRVIEAAYDGPEVIPAELFDGHLDTVRRQMQQLNKVELVGRSWEQVTVSVAPADMGVGIEPKSPKIGRPRVGPLLAKVVAALSKEGRLTGIMVQGERRSRA